MSTQTATTIYRALEWLGGEKTKGIAIIPYKYTQKLKLEVLRWL